MNTDAAVNLARTVWADLREKRLWPVALVLALALIAVPVVLSHSASPPAVSSPLAAAGTGAGGPAIPALSVQDGPSYSRLGGPARNPFIGTGASPTATTGSAPSGSSGAGAGTTSASSGSPGASGGPSSTTSGGGTAVSGPVPSGGAPAPPLPPQPPPPAPTGLAANQSYSVALSITNASGGLNQVDPLPRLSLIPGPQEPLLVELGVLQGGHRVLFAVPSGTVLHGPGTCVPGPIDCEIMSLGQDQIESVSLSAGGGAVAMFAVTGITATDHPSDAAAQTARRSVSRAGSQFMATLSMPALSLFQYDPGIGAVVDLRNLSTGGS